MELKNEQEITTTNKTLSKSSDSLLVERGPTAAQLHNGGVPDLSQRLEELVAARRQGMERQQLRQGGGRVVTDVRRASRANDRSDVVLAPKPQDVADHEKELRRRHGTTIKSDTEI